MNIDATKALIDGVLQGFDPLLSAHFIPAENPESEDDEFEIHLDGKRLDRGRSAAGYDRSTYSIQCCLIGGGFATNELCFRGEDLRFSYNLYGGNNARAAAEAVIKRLQDSKPAAEPKRPAPAPEPQFDSIRAGMVGAAEKVEVADRFSFDLANSPKIVVTDKATGRTCEFGLCDYHGVRKVLGALFEGE